MNDPARWFLLLTGVAFLAGLRGSWRLTRRYRDVSPQLLRRERMLLGAIVGVAWLITASAGYFAFFSVRRILGFPPVDWTPAASVAIATAILFIPAGLDYVVGLVARVPWR